MKNIITKLFFSIIAALPMLSLGKSEQTWFDKAFGAFGQSAPVHLFSKYCMRPISWLARIRLGNVQLASPELQKKWEEAQDASGVAKNRRLPLYVLTDYSRYDDEWIGETSSKAVYLSRCFVEENDSDKLKNTLRHEAVHVKYNDAATGLILMSVIGGSTGFLSTKLLQKSRGEQTISLTTMASGAIVGILSTIKFCQWRSSYVERRADIEAAYASACGKCVEKWSEDRSDFPSIFMQGYLLKSQFMKIADELKQQNKYCKRHKNDL